MNKKNIVIVILIIAIALICILSVKRRREYTYKQDYIDKLCAGYLSQSASGFNIKYNEMEFSDKNYQYTQALVGISCADDLLILTSYDKNNNKLDGALFALRSYMIQHSPLNQEVDYDINVDIFNLILKLSMDLDSEEKAEELKEYLTKLE
ncbi:hypothetical protein AN1V17_16610 [Vallitalea sediminicola]